MNTEILSILGTVIALCVWLVKSMQRSNEKAIARSDASHAETVGILKEMVSRQIDVTHELSTAITRMDQSVSDQSAALQQFAKAIDELREDIHGVKQQVRKTHV
jgi:methyl-accepting chemotaxis protein